MALESDLVTSDAIEATEFADLAEAYRVFAVPKTVINGTAFVEGALPESLFVDRVLKALGIEAEPGTSSQ